MSESETGNTKVSPDEHHAIWRKVDEHSERLSEIEAWRKIVEFRQAKHEEELNQMASDTRHYYSKIIAKLDMMGERVYSNEQKNAVSEGVQQYKKWVIGLGISVFGLVITLTGMWIRSGGG